MKNTTFFSLLLGVLLISCYPLPTAASEVKAHYTSAQGKIITLKLVVGNPPPNTIIVIQQVPPGAKIVRSIPSHSSYKKNRGEIKWLIKQPTAGNLNIKLHLKKPVQAGSVSAMVRYMDVNDGTFQTEMVR